MEMTLRFFEDDLESYSKSKTGFHSNRSQMWRCVVLRTGQKAQ